MKTIKEYSNHPFGEHSDLAPKDFIKSKTYTFKEALKTLKASPDELCLIFNPKADNVKNCIQWVQWIEPPDEFESVPADISEIKKICIYATSNNGMYPLGYTNIKVKSGDRRILARKATITINHYLKQYNEIDVDCQIYVFFKSEDWCPFCGFFDESEGHLTAQGIENQCPNCNLTL